MALSRELFGMLFRPEGPPGFSAGGFNQVPGAEPLQRALNKGAR
jgi:hypothetical protein